LSDSHGAGGVQLALLNTLTYLHVMTMMMMMMMNIWYSTSTLCSKKSDAVIQITITMAQLIRINYPLSSFNYRLSGTKVANFNKIHHIVHQKGDN